MSQITANITGYRQLSEDEQALINRIKAHEAETMRLVREVRVAISEMRFESTRELAVKPTESDAIRNERERMDNAEPERWAALARTDLQTGFMYLVRAVAQPVTP